MKAVLQNVNIRGHEVKENKSGDPYIIVRFEDETGKPETVIDKDMDRENIYVRDTTADIFISIDVGRQFTTIRVEDVKVHEG